MLLFGIKLWLIKSKLTVNILKKSPGKIKCSVGTQIYLLFATSFELVCSVTTSTIISEFCVYFFMLVFFLDRLTTISNSFTATSLPIKNNFDKPLCFNFEEMRTFFLSRCS